MTLLVLDEAAIARARVAAAGVPDPEIPGLTIGELGILRSVELTDGGLIEVTILPTYSGCPAMGAISISVEAALAAAGFPEARVKLAYAPAWSTDMMSDAGREKLRLAGIAPPRRRAGKRALFAADEPVQCPRCGSAATEKISEFGSTACKALWRCLACREPFDHFKCI
jgi:ring-1,2-phenylacetyl-CoA epoxidase subunit PaaD